MATIYREGSTDREMNKRIQKVVGVSADGVWGPKTTAAVKAWQKAHLLQADGLVGPATLAAMGLSEDAGRQTATTEGITITKAPINQHITRCQNRPIRYIAIHYTAGSTSGEGAAMRNRNVFLKRAASADFCVDDKTIIQVNPDLKNYYCWSVGDKKNPWTGGGRLNGKTDISPMWRIKRLTEMFGPCGIGWWYVIKDQRLLEGADKEVKAFVDIDLYYRWGEQVSQPIPGVGGNTFVEKGGKYTSDECFKMALTDAISVAAKAIGVGGSVYYGGERTKYSMAEAPAAPHPPAARAPSPQGEGRLEPTQAKPFTCDCCGKPLAPYKDREGRNVSLRAHAERSMQKFGKVLCLDCMPRG